MSDDAPRPENEPPKTPTDPVVFGPHPPPTAKRSGPAWLRFLYNQNPFYLLSTCCVLHGSAHLLKPPVLVGDSPPIDPWPVVALVGGYLVLMAVTAFLVVRFGRVWDDARSMLVIVLLLFVEIAISFDQSFADARVDLLVGALPALLGLLFATLVTEFLLRGLGIRLPIGFRLPYYLLLALLFLYPAVPVAVHRHLGPQHVPWALYAFSLVAGLALLLLLPAIRRGRAYTRENGTPWLWPMFPWTIFVVLLVGLGLRAYAMPQAFDPVLGQTRAEAMAFSTVFQPYFLVPIVFAVAILLLEIGLVESNGRVQKIALAIPFGCLLLSLPVTTLRGPDAGFLAEFTRLLGHPVHVTAIGVVGFAGLARLRRVPLAEPVLALSLVVLAYTSPAGTWIRLVEPWWLVAAALLLGLESVRHRDTRRGLCSMLLFVLAAQPWLRDNAPVVAEHLLHQTAVAFYVAALAGRDDFARRLRTTLLVLLPLLAVRQWLHASPAGVADWMWRWDGDEAITSADLRVLIPLVEQLAVLVASATLTLARPSREAVVSSACVGTATAGTWIRIVIDILARHPRWIAIRSLGIGALLFVVAVLISLSKAGALRWVWRRLLDSNERGRGLSSTPEHG